MRNLKERYRHRFTQPFRSKEAHSGFMSTAFGLDSYQQAHTGIIMTTSDSLSSADGQSSTPTKDSIAFQCRKERELAHAYALEVSAMRGALTVQRKLMLDAHEGF
jgi:hypothetical protein